MLVYTCRASIRGLGTQVPRSSTHLVRSIWSLSRVINATYSHSSAEQSGFKVGDISLIKQILRTYATRTTAAKASTTKASTTKKPRATKATKSGRAKPKATAAKKTGGKTKKTPTKKPTKKKTTAAASSRARGGRKKKPLTKELQTKARIREYKKVALVVPKGLPRSAYQVLQGEIAKEKRAIAGKETAQRYRNLTPEELEHYNHIANQNAAANDAAYKNWVESHTADEIREANNARAQLRRLLRKTKQGSRTHKFPKIKDQRQPKGVGTPYIQFFKDRMQSGDFRHMAVKDRTSLVAREWKGLAADEKEKFQRRSQADQSRYLQEFKTVFNRDAPSANKKAGAKTNKVAAATRA